MNKQVEKLCKLGATDREIAEFFDIAESTLNLWKSTHPKFMESIKKGKMLADAEVAEKLYRRATGYSHPDVDIKVIDDQIVLTRLTKHYAPDTAAAIFWLKNRRNRADIEAQKWADKQLHELTGKDGSKLFEEKSDDELKAILAQTAKKLND